MRSILPCAAVVSLVLVAACDEPAMLGGDGEIAYRPGGYGCSVCGIGLGNSATINGNAIPEFNLAGEPNAYGVVLGGVQRPGVAGFLDVSVDPVTNSFVGINADGEVELSGAQFSGVSVRWLFPGGSLWVSIDAVQTVPSWAAGGGGVTAYRATYKGKDGKSVPLCPAAATGDQWFTLTYGELYDRATHDVTANVDDWVTMACMTEAAAKVKMLGYHGGGPAQATADETKTTLHMITADYCGIGHSFTASGTQVAWRDVKGLVAPPFAETVMEAKWGPNGATCLNTPRWASADEVSDYCAIPTCGDTKLDHATPWRTMLP